MSRSAHLAGASVASIFAGRFGQRIALAPPDDPGAAVLDRLDTHHREVKTALDAASKTAADHGKALDLLKDVPSRLTELEQRAVSGPRGGGDPQGGKTIGRVFTESAEFKALTAGGGISSGRRAQIEVKTITSAATSAGAMVAPDIQTVPVVLPQRRMTIRDLIAAGETVSNMVWYPQMTSRTNNAATVAENPSAWKPQSDFNVVQAQAPVRTIAHWMLVSNQMMEDAPAMAATIDSELRYGLEWQEEVQILYGDGTGTNLLGIMPQATAYSQPPGIVVPSTITQLDTLLMAFAQAEMALLPASGVVLNPIDYANILMLKDANGRYIGGGPLEALAQAFWSVPKVVTPVILQGQFLVGAFKDGAQIFDRQRATVLASTEDSDNFRKNLTTVLGEERIALAVKRPQAFIKGTF